MTIRIYVLAKRLQIESKVLLDACKKLGINDKNNPLSSLSNDEIRRVTDFVNGEAEGSRVDEAEKKFEMVRPVVNQNSNSGAVKAIKPSVKPVLTTPRPNRLISILGGKRQGSIKTSEVKNKVAPSVATESAEAKEASLAKSPSSVKLDNEESVLERGSVVATDVSLVGTENAGLVKQNVVRTESDDSVSEISELTVSSSEKSDSEKKELVADDVQCSSEDRSENDVITDKKNNVSVDTPKVEETIGSNSVSSVVEESEKKEVQVVTAGKVEGLAPSSVKQEDAGKEELKVDSRKIVDRKPVVTRSNVVSQVVVKKTPGASPVSNRRDRNNEQRNKDERRGNDRNRGNDRKQVDSRPVRPVMPSYLTPDPKALQEMKEPPKITNVSHDSGRVRVLGVGQKKVVNLNGPTSGGSSNGHGGSKSSGNTNSRFIPHLAPMPTAPQKPVTKKVQEEPAQKPVQVFSQEALRRARNVAGSGGLTSYLMDKNARNQSKDNSEKRSADRRGSRDGNKDVGSRDNSGRDSKFSSTGRNGLTFGRNAVVDAGVPMGGSGKGSRGDRKKGGRDRDSEGNENIRNKNSENQRRRGNNQNFSVTDDDEPRFTRVGRTRGKKGSSANVTAPRVSDVVIQMPCTVKQFSESTGVSVATVIKELLKIGVIKTMNQFLDTAMMELIIDSLNLKATVKEEETLEEQYVDSVFDEVDAPESLVPRAPVVTFLGHVDHGKTSLLDRILHLHVVSGERGGITQHIRAYRVDTPRGAVTFVDTPGHEAFTEMRARGANCTDVAVLVVAADDGVMPQTEEAISHAKAAGVPIVVALNKMDLPGVNRDRVIQELANNDLMPSEWGGDVEVVNTSAVTGMGVDELLDTLLTVAELHELKANPNRRATGVVLEASLQAGQGVCCKALVQNGTLRNGDIVLCGSSYGRVRSMTDTLPPFQRIQEAGPSVPVTLTGLDVAPEAGSKFIVLEDISVARQIAEERQAREREIELAGAPGHVTLENLFERMNSAKQQTLNVIIRADVRGSIEAIRKEMGKLEHPEVKVKILQASVGGITEADVHLADASDAIIVGFNVVPDEGARALAEKKQVQIRRYDIIYKLTEDIHDALVGMLKPIEQVKELGRALVQRTFSISHVGVIAGCRVLSGVIERDCQIRVIRDQRVIGEYQLDTLKRVKDDVKEVRDGYECGMKLKNYNDVKEGDVLEAYKIEEIARTF